jgi:hypothetical protein
MFGFNAYSEGTVSAASGLIYVSSVSDAAALADQPSGFATFSTIVFDEASTSGAYYMVGETFHTVVEQASVSQLRFLGGGFSSASMSSGPFSGLGDDLVTVSGDLFFAQTTVRGVLAEILIGADIIQTRGQYTIPVNEAASGSDAPIGNIEFVRTFSDAATQADFILGNPAFSSSVVEAGSGTEVMSSIPTYAVSFTDASAMASVVSSLTTVISTVQDTAVIQGVVPTNIVGNSTVINSASYTDFITSSVVFSTNVVTAAHTLDQISVRLQWEPVPTATPTDWTLINTLS